MPSKKSIANKPESRKKGGRDKSGSKSRQRTATSKNTHGNNKRKGN